MASFDRIAPIYDRLSTWVYGSTLMEAQLAHLQKLPCSGNMLILGGGTGWILQQVLCRRPGLKIWYVESSIKMIELTKQRSLDHQQVVYIHGDEQKIPNEIQYDVVLFHFVLDVFTHTDLRLFLLRLRDYLASDSKVYLADFMQTKKLFHRVLLWIMYRFFRMLCGMRAKRLPPWPHLMEEAGFRELSQAQYFRGFVRSSVYAIQKSGFSY